MNITPLKSVDFDDLENDPIYLSIFSKSGHKVYAAKMDAVQVAILNYKEGHEISFGSTDHGNFQTYNIIELRSMLVRNGKKHEIHLRVIVD